MKFAIWPLSYHVATIRLCVLRQMFRHNGSLKSTPCCTFNNTRSYSCVMWNTREVMFLNYTLLYPETVIGIFTVYSISHTIIQSVSIIFESAEIEIFLSKVDSPTICEKQDPQTWSNVCIGSMEYKTFNSTTIHCSDFVTRKVHHICIVGVRKSNIQQVW